MIAQIILSLGLTVSLFYVISLGRSQPVIRYGLSAVILVGYVFVWYPSITTEIALMVGIGRGADLVTYLWIVLNLFLILRLHLKLREQTVAITTLARELTLRQAEPVGGGSDREVQCLTGSTGL